MRFSDLRIGARLTLGFGVLLLLIGVVAGLSAWRLAALADVTRQLATVDAQLERTMLGWVGETRSNAVRAVVVARSSDAELVNLLTPQVEAATKRINGLQKQVEELIVIPQAKALFADIGERRKAYISARSDAVTARKAGSAAEAVKIVDTQMVPAVETYLAAMQKLVDFQKEHAERTAKEAQDTAASAQRLIAAAVVAALLFGIGLAWRMTRSITLPVSQALTMAQGVAVGDLSRQAAHRSRDEVGQLLDAMRSMQERLKSFVAEQERLAKQHEAGAVSARMKAEEFPGAYGEIGQQVNALIDGHVKVQQRVMEVMARYAKGDFSVEIEALPGERAAVKQALDQVKSNLQNVNADLMVLIAAAGKGEFSTRGDAERYEFAFRGMVEGLNRLMEIIERALSDLGVVLGALAQGDLTHRVTSDYRGMLLELKNNTNGTVDKLTEITGQIKGAVESINVASKEIAQGNTDLSSRTEEQASSLEETASSMEELTGTVKQNAENAKQANQLVAGASEVAVRGGEVVKQVVSTMSSINESSKKIVDIISVIDGIAFQTNILALNAAVEAARAGEQGRGFAVVATEVRNLAQRSAAAAKEIKELIGDSVEKVEAGTKLVDHAGKTMEEIVTSVKRVTDIMSEITAASQEQSGGIEQVNTAITQMDEVTQQNAALVEEAAAAAESLEEQARNLAEAVAVFKVAQGAAVSRPAPAPAKVTALPGAHSAVRPTTRMASAAAPRATAKAAVAAEDRWEEF
ncbi:MAG TPA: methyl-accepting chemotaxis protein [Burkholderiales bacterium]|nr:methyl-accepting chemotaxis protein [Burkholderiales bacterium]